MLLRTTSIILLVSAFSACDSQTEPVATADETEALDTAKADGATSASALDNATFFLAEHDQRKCASPMCGGYFVHRVNYATTKCFDGAYAAKCYVGTLDLAPLGLSPDQVSEVESAAGAGQILLRGALKPGGFTGRPTIAKFKATEAWQAATDVPPTGTFYAANNNGHICVAAPCKTINGVTLNHTGASAVGSFAGLDLTAAGASAGQEADAQTDLLASRILVAATTAPVYGPGGGAKQLVASQFYLRVVPDATGQTCGTRGAQPCPTGYYCDFPATAQCGWADAPGTCALTPEICMALYAPVCGCDSQTYGNACNAASAGVAVLHTGACK